MHEGEGSLGIYISWMFEIREHTALRTTARGDNNFISIRQSNSCQVVCPSLAFASYQPIKIAAIPAESLQFQRTVNSSSYTNRNVFFLNSISITPRDVQVKGLLRFHFVITPDEVLSYTKPAYLRLFFINCWLEEML